MMSPGFRTAGPGYTGIGSLGERLNGYNSYVPSEIFQDVNMNQTQRIIGALRANWRPLPWMQNDATVGVDYIDRNGIFLLPLPGMPPLSGTLRLGATSSSTTNNRNFSAKVTSAGTWQAKPWMNLKTTAGSGLHQRRARRHERERSTASAGRAQNVGLGRGAECLQLALDRDQDVGLLPARKRWRSAIACSSPPPSAPTRTARSARTSSASCIPS